jgi:nitrate reductase beta subunit
VPRLAHVRLRLPVQEDLLQLDAARPRSASSATRIEAGQPTVCSETCVGRIRYLGVLLYDADRIEAAAVADERTCTRRSWVVPRPARSGSDRRGAPQGIPEPGWSRRKSPVYKMAMEWKVAFPLHPEYRTLPMVWYVPPLSPIQAAAESADGHERHDPGRESLRIPVQYLANLLTAGDQRRW